FGLGSPHSSNRHSFASRSEANLSHVLARSDHVFLASGVVDVFANRTQSSACWRHSLGSIGMRVVSAFRYSKEAPVIFPIPGTKRRQYLEENVGALDIRLTADELAEIDSLIPPGAAAGSRYSEPGMRAVNR